MDGSLEKIEHFYKTLIKSDDFGNLIFFYKINANENKVHQLAITSDSVKITDTLSLYGFLKKNYFDIEKNYRKIIKKSLKKLFTKTGNDELFTLGEYKSNDPEKSGIQKWYKAFAVKYEINGKTECFVIITSIEKKSEKENEDRYIHALLSDAVAYFEFNLTRNKIIGSPVQIIDDHNFPMLESLGLEKNCSYEDFTEAYCSNMSQSMKELYKSRMNIQTLLENFNKGVYEIKFDYSMRSFENNLFWARNSVILTTDKKKKQVFGIVVVKDISREHKDTEEKNHQSEIINGLSTDFNNIVEINILTNELKSLKLSEDNYSLYNKVLKGLPYEDALDLYVRFCVYEYDKDLLYIAFSKNNLLKQLKLRKSFSVNYRKKIEGKIENIKLNVARIGDENNFKGILFGFINIDNEIEHELEQKKLLEEAVRMAEIANEAKTKFLSTMSHDIRTPMNAISGFTTLALQHREDMKLVEDYLNKIQNSSNHLLNLINDILDMSRIESGKLKITNAPCNINEIISDIENVISSQVDTNGLKYKREKINIRNENIFCDRLRVNQILLNLLGNSVKFTKKGGSVYFGITQLEYENIEYAAYKFTVRDNGIGMSDEIKEHLFEPFARDSNNRVNKIQGTGLGMSITKNLVDLMEGSIEFTSEIDKGTEFNVYIKFKAMDQNDLEVLEQKKKDDFDINTIKGKKILLVDDDAFNREIAITLLTESGFVVDFAESGQDAIEKYSSSPNGFYDIILMDLMMPIMNGYEATKQLRNIQSNRNEYIPIIAMSANAFEEDKRKVLEVGMDSHISKPINIKHLLSTLAKYLQIKKT